MILYYETKDSLSHHGIKGQKWGVRRYQNKDGTLTIAGKKRQKHNDDHHVKDSNLSIIPTLLSLATFDPFAAKRLIDAGVAAAKTGSTNNDRQKCELDKKTGFLLKHRSFSQEEDAARVNPGFKNFNTNTKSNCMLCTATYDLRRRGYEVRAKTASVGYTNDDIKRWYKNPKIERAKYEAYYGVIPKPKEVKARIEDITNRLIKQGDGARGNIMVRWKNSIGAGHSMVYEVSGGKVKILCTQSNKIYNNPASILKQTTGDVEYVRTDNLQINIEAIKETCE